MIFKHPLLQSISLAQQLYSNNMIIRDLNDGFSDVQFSNEIISTMKKLYSLGLGSGDVVLANLSRTVELPAILCAFLEMGITFVPLEKNISLSRLQTIFIESKARYVIISDDFIVPDCNGFNNVFHLNQLKEANFDQSPSFNPRTTAYIMFTSGSTGKPKGVVVSHKAIINAINGCVEKLTLSSYEHFIATTTLTFDIALLELLAPVAVGAKLTIIGDELKHDMPRFISWLNNACSGSIMQATPSYWQLLIDGGWENKKNLTLLSGGEKISQNLVNKLLTISSTLWNLYGPTESTIWVSAKKINRTDKDISIGSPISNVNFFLVSDDKIISEQGIQGELYITGDSLADGYLNDLPQTEVKFDVFLGEKVYKTGDLFEVSRANELVFVGRKDRQIKFNGQRLELEGIEAIINKVDFISKSYVDYVEEEKNDYLHAYVSLDKSKKYNSLDFSILFFGSKHETDSPYNLYFSAAKYADNNGFKAVWTPERHFDEVGGLFPNPAILNAALSQITNNIELRAGSVVLPINNILQTVENWSVLDQITNGRIGVAFASGWHPQDFVLSNKNFFERKQILEERIAQFQKLWAGSNLKSIDGVGFEREISTYPKPKTKEPSLWLTVSGNPETFKLAGKFGLNILTHILEQDITELEDKIIIYKNSLIEHGYDPSLKTVTLMLHTYISNTDDMSSPRSALECYIKDYLKLLSRMNGSSEDIDVEVPESTLRKILQNSLIGTVDDCYKKLEIFSKIGVTEVASFIDFGMSDEKILDGLSSINDLKNEYNKDAGLLKNKIFSILKENLPGHAVPSKLSIVENFPQKNNGKLNVEELIKNNDKSVLANKNLSNNDDVAYKIYLIWKELLKINSIEYTDNFFEIGGHSLLAMRVITKLQKKHELYLDIKGFFSAPTILGLADLVSVCDDKEEFSKLSSKSSELSIAEKQIFFANELSGDSQRYNDVIAFELDGNLDMAKLKAALDELIINHEIFRTTFVYSNGKVKRRVEPSFYFELDEIFLPENEGLMHALKQNCNVLFDVSVLPLFKVTLIKKNENKFVLMIVIHHLITDGWSMSILLSELSKYYNYEDKNLRKQLPQYANYIALSADEHQGVEKYWKFVFDSDIEVLDFPKKGLRPISETYVADRFDFKIIKSLAREIEVFCVQHEITLYSFLISIYVILLKRYTNQKSFAVGVPMANRNTVEAEEIIGCFVNTLPLLVNTNLDSGFIEYSKAIHEELINIYQNKQVSLVELLKEFYPNRDASMHTLFQTMCVLHNAPERIINFHGIVAKEMAFSNPQTRMDFSIGFEKMRDDSIRAYIEFNKDLYDGDLIEQFAHQYENLVETVLNNGNKALSNIQILDQYEINDVLNRNERYSDSKINGFKTKLFSAIDSEPDKMALLDENNKFTYSQLNNYANKLANQLVRLGLKSKHIVALNISRSAKGVALLLAFLKLNITYIVIKELNVHSQRLLTILEQVNVACIISDEILESLDDRKVICFKDFLLQADRGNDTYKVSPEDPNDNIALVYTSGSTGEPKGIMITDIQLTHFFENIDILRLERYSTVLQAASWDFDASFFEMWGCFIQSGCLIIAEQDVLLSPEKLSRLIIAHKIDYAFLTAGLFQQYCQSAPNIFDPLKTIVFGGDVINPDTLNNYIDGSQLRPFVINGYGPTEATIFSSIEYITKGVNSSEYSIGKPLRHVKTFILDEHMNLQPDGVIGEICLSGIGVLTEYYKDNDDHKLVFSNNPYDGNSSLYKTGDYGFWRDGRIIFVGRKDRQIKIRGYRLNLFEIESEIVKSTLISQCVVLAEEDALDKKIVAYIIPSKQESDLEHIDAWKKLYQKLYDNKSINEQNFIGWESSFTGEEIPESEMYDWQEDIVYKIGDVKNKHILEIGLGTGLIAEKLLPSCASYTGLDFSNEVILYAQNRFKIYGEKLKLLNIQADDVKNLNDTFDVIILNSVVQYFPSANYLRDVVTQCFGKLNSGALFFIGDIRDYRYEDIYHFDMLSHKNKIENPAEVFTLINQCKSQERELLVSPNYLLSIVNECNSLFSCEFYKKAGEASNEMVLYRYDMTIKMEKPKSNDLLWLDWQLFPVTASMLDERLKSGKDECIAIKNISIVDLVKKEKLLKKMTGMTGKDLLEESSLITDKELSAYEVKKISDKYSLFCMLYLSDVKGCFDLILSKNKIRKKNWKFDEVGLGYNEPSRTVPSVDQMKKEIEKILPKFMRPQKIQIVNELPLTNNNKIDLIALKKICSQSLEVIQKKRHEAIVETEPFVEELIGIWKDVLRINDVSENDDFFSIGGDSIICIHLIAKARQRGIIIEPKQVFENPTIQGLSKVVVRLEAENLKREIVTYDADGGIPLSPIQHWFFEQNFSNIHHWNQAFLVKPKHRLKWNDVKEACLRIYEHHESLQIKFKKTNGSWSQFYRSDYSNIGFDYKDLSSDEHLNIKLKIEEFCNQAQKSLNIENGPLMKVVLMDFPKDEQRLFIVIHHLVIDSISWYIIFEDLEDLLGKIECNTILTLPKKSDNFKTWTNVLLDHVKTSGVKSEIEHWCGLNDKNVLIPLDNPKGRNVNFFNKSFCFIVEEGITKTLVTLSKSELNVSVDVILLACIIWAFRQDCPEGFIINLDTHGRESISKSIDLTRTVGWFTAFHPLYVKPESSLTETIHSVAKDYSSVQAKGFNSSLLKYLCENISVRERLKSSPAPKVGLNYFGQFFQNFGEASIFEKADEIPGIYRDQDSERSYWLEINAYVRNDKFYFDWSYSTDLLNDTTINGWAKQFQSNLSDVADSLIQKNCSSKLIKLNDNNDGAKLFFIHPIGGMTHWYNNLANYLSSEYQVYAVEAFGVYGNEEYIDSIEKMAEKYVDMIVDSHQETEYILLGWSFGCDVAFEMAKIIRKRGFAIKKLVLLDPQFLTSNPQKLMLGIANTMSRLYDIKIKYERLNLSDFDFLSNIEGLVDNLNIQIKDSHLEYEIRRTMKLYFGHLKAKYNYKISGKISSLIVINAAKPFDNEREVVTENIPSLFWEDFCDNLICKEVNNADHFTILSEIAFSTINSVLND